VRRRRALAALAAAALGGALLLRRRADGRRERVDLYFEDGSMVSLEGGSPEAQRVLPIARDLLSTAGG
jgi:hypothetical protein